MDELSKYLCLLLRHQPEKAELDMDSHGWVSVEQLIDGVNHHSSYKLDRELLDQIVEKRGDIIELDERIALMNQISFWMVQLVFLGFGASFTMLLCIGSSV